MIIFSKMTFLQFTKCYQSASGNGFITKKVGYQQEYPVYFIESFQRKFPTLIDGIIKKHHSRKE